eukprot:g661.t1
MFNKIPFRVLGQAQVFGQTRRLQFARAALAASATVSCIGFGFHSCRFGSTESSDEFLEEQAKRYKKHFADSYNEVAEMSSNSDNENELVQSLRRLVARALMHRLGYSDEELDAIGEDVDKMQGTGNPFPLARLRPGEVVLDLGSGFGIDALLAGQKVGEEGRVVGIDLSHREVSSANERALSRGVTNCRFYQMDIEALDAIPDNSIDCVISNGGFCLVPNKRKAFQEVWRVLKPGGRFSISCTTLRKGYGSINKFMTDKDAQAAADFPSCMEVFLPLDAAKPMLSDLGFSKVVVDDSNSKMSVWKEVEDLMESEVEKRLAKIHGVLPKKEVLDNEAVEAEIMTKLVKKGGKSTEKKHQEKDKIVSEQKHQKGVHGGGKNPRYEHMSKLSMDDICARVVLYGEK